jgi:hypothetical protein
MTCERYKMELSAAAAGETSPALQVHLDACGSCRSFIASERSLLEAIDAGVSRAVSEVPSADFLPRVRAALEREELHASHGGHYWMAFWPSALVAAVVLCALILTGRFHSIPVAEPQRVPAVAAAGDPAILHSLPPEGPLAGQPLRSGRKLVANRVRAERADNPATPEIIVPSDEREALAHFVAGLATHREVAVALARPAPFEPAPDAVKAGDLEIARLEVAPLIPPEKE